MDPRQQLDVLLDKNLLRAARPSAFPAPMRITRDGREMWNFASNDYLGLAAHPAIAAAFTEGIGKFGTGSTASRLITGTHPPHAELEDSIATAKHTTAALTFSSGYTTALATIPIIAGKGDFIILDRLAHACLIDGARASAATLRIFPHNSPEKLSAILSSIRSRHPRCRILVITESIFSMDGDVCPLLEILHTCENFSADLLLDEAHAVGILGPTGMGLAEQLGLQQRIAFQMGTLSKALGLSGGYLATSRDWIDLMINRARPFIYSTAPPPALAHAALASLSLIRSAEGNSLRQNLFHNTHLLRPHHPSAIIVDILGSNEATLTASSALAEKGFLIPAIRFPTVARGSARLRITTSAAHPTSAIRALAQVLREMPPPALR